MAIDLEKSYENRKGVYDIILQEGDKIIIPQYVSTVKISGAVVYPNATTYLPGKKLKEHILNAGGYMQNARKRAYVVLYERPGCHYQRQLVREDGIPK